MSSLSQVNTAHSTANVKDISEKLVQCEHCQTFIPEDKAIVSGKKFYCSPHHAKL